MAEKEVVNMAENERDRRIQDMGTLKALAHPCGCGCTGP